MRVCRCCGKEKALTDFYTNGKTPTGKVKHKPLCKTCDIAEKKKRNLSIVSEVFPVLECQRCGYNKCSNALEFHHKDPSQKDAALSFMLVGAPNRDRLIAELKKCVLLCANCHREYHAGLFEI